MARDTLVTGTKLTALANSIRTKAGTQSSMTLDDMKTTVDGIQTGGGADTAYLKAMIERPSNAQVVIPAGTTKIGDYAFYYFKNLTSITIPNSITEIGNYAFVESGLIRIEIPSSVTLIGYSAFSDCSNLSNATINSSITGDSMFMNCPNLLSITLGSNVLTIQNRLAAGCRSLTSLHIPNSITRIISGLGITYNCPNLEYVTIQNGFNANNLDLSASGSTKFSVETIVSWLNALADRTGLSAYTLKIGTPNINKLTTDQIAIATNKNWNLA